MTATPPKSHPMQDEVKVSQADVGWATSAAQHLCSPQDRDAAIRLLAQAFARHRTQALADHRALVEALGIADGIIEADLMDAIEHGDADWEGQTRTALEAIRALVAKATGDGL